MAQARGPYLQDGGRAARASCAMSGHPPSRDDPSRHSPAEPVAVMSLI